MKYLIIALLVATGSVVSAHELDSENTVSARQVELAKALPATVVVRVSKSDPKQIEVVHLKQHLAAGQTAEGLKFEKMAINSEVSHLAYTVVSELDGTSSTSSWRFGFGGYYGGYGRGYYGGYGGYYPSYGYGYGYTYPSYGYGYSNGCYSGCGGAYYYAPQYYYGGYTYAYAPYYGYADNNYYYTCYGW